MKEIIQFNKKLNNLHYFEPVFGQNFVFLVAPFTDSDYENVCGWIGCDAKPQGERRGTTLFSQCSKKIGVVIWDPTQSVVFHELIHAAMSTFRKIGDKVIHFDNEEAFAYYCGRLAEVLYSFHPAFEK
jgi:hypothetical protein